MVGHDTSLVWRLVNAIALLTACFAAFQASYDFRIHVINGSGPVLSVVLKIILCSKLL